MRDKMILAFVASGWLVACSDSAGSASPSGAAGVVDAGAEGSPFASGTEVRIPVPDTGRVFVNLSSTSLVTPADPNTSLDWDLAFEGLDVFTNSGVSGAGKAAAFGPLDGSTFADDAAPAVPFLSEDKAGGAFLDWYAYEGQTHALWSRYHIYGVRDGARLWKVQVLTYYGQRDGAAVSALYKIRYAELTATGAGMTIEVTDLDGTAGGTAAPESAASECVDLGTGARTMLTPEAARGSNAWHLCFRRASIGVNGEIGGPRGVRAVDLGEDLTLGETVDVVKARTAESEAPAFDGALAPTFDGKSGRGDRVVSAFSDHWLDTTASPLAPVSATWLVQDATGKHKFFLGFTALQTPSATSPGTVVARIKPVKG